MSFFRQVYAQVQRIPPGKVATYGQIARLCGSPRAARAVGFALHQNPSQSTIPCHRVVNRHGFLSGNFAFGGIASQKMLLQTEGVAVSQDYIVNLAVYGWDEGENAHD